MYKVVTIGKFTTKDEIIAMLEGFERDGWIMCGALPNALFSDCVILHRNDKKGVR